MGSDRRPHSPRISHVSQRSLFEGGRLPSGVLLCSGLGPLVSTGNARHVCDGRTVSVSRPYHSWLYQFFEPLSASRIRSAFPQGHYASAFRSLRCHSRAGSRATFSSQIGRHCKIRSRPDDVFHRQVSDEQQRFSRHRRSFAPEGVRKIAARFGVDPERSLLGSELIITRLLPWNLTPSGRRILNLSLTLRKFAGVHFVV